MSTYKRKSDFSETQEGIEAKRILQAMMADPLYNTRSSYSANVAVYPDNTMTFVDKHMDYMRRHPATNPKHYVANLRLMTRVK